MKTQNLEIIINEFKSKSGVTDRYTSFDYCYNYFRETKDLNENVEKSCLVLWSYLASWGMLRGSSFLLQKNPKHFQKLIVYYSTLDKETWNIDINKYSPEVNSKIIDIYEKTKESVIIGDRAHLTLITKILLGVFGFIPAYDQYFRNSFREIFKGKCAFSVVNRTSLNCLKEFYDANKEEIDDLSKKTLTTDFYTGKKTTIPYTRAKIIDMYGFTIGINKKNKTYP